MPAINITELWLKNAHNRVDDKPIEFTHDGIDFEFGVTINPPSKRYPKGTKSWFTRYPWQGTKRGRRDPLGRYPTVKLAEALEEAKERQRKAARGIDPRRPVQEASEELSFGQLFEKYFEEKSLKKVRPDKDSSAYRLYLSDWADYRAKDITRQMARERFKEIKDAGKPAQCNVVQFLVNAIFNWALDQEIVDRNPIHRLAPQGRIKDRERYLTDHELRKLLELLHERRDWPATVLHLMLLTGQRKADLLKMRWSKIQDGCWLVLPGKIEMPDGKVIPGTKNEKTHLVYLTPPALTILDRLRVQAAPGSDWVYPKVSDPSVFRHFGNFYKNLRELRREVSSEDWRPHDLRRTVVTNLSRLGCPDKIKMAIVNHTETHVHKKVYDLWKHAPEKRHWMTRWADFLEALRNGEDISRFLPYAPSSEEDSSPLAAASLSS